MGLFLQERCCAVLKSLHINGAGPVPFFYLREIRDAFYYRMRRICRSIRSYLCTCGRLSSNPRSPPVAKFIVPQRIEWER
ncbi:hypothetical protein VTK73DRAFT_1070 [Phialemonium thermophilum]|uniref:Uncharacterized protein n=1 Tax=Phialemonium thermophilum TaxID=223376 RepID=A0ABR3VTX8_9PEZI